jgi:hypothetical protein
VGKVSRGERGGTVWGGNRMGSTKFVGDHRPLPSGYTMRLRVEQHQAVYQISTHCSALPPSGLVTILPNLVSG